MGLVIDAHVWGIQEEGEAGGWNGRSMKQWILSEYSACWLYLSCCLVAQLCPTFCDPVDCNPPDSSVRGILQARILGWVAIFSSRGSSLPRDRTPVSCIFCTGRRLLYCCATQEVPAVSLGAFKFHLAIPPTTSHADFCNLLLFGLKLAQFLLQDMPEAWGMKLV